MTVMAGERSSAILYGHTRCWGDSNLCEIGDISYEAVSNPGSM
jgi:hypothetical protein